MNKRVKIVLAAVLLVAAGALLVMNSGLLAPDPAKYTEPPEDAAPVSRAARVAPNSPLAKQQAQEAQKAQQGGGN